MEYKCRDVHANQWRNIEIRLKKFGKIDSQSSVTDSTYTFGERMARESKVTVRITDPNCKDNATHRERIVTKKMVR